MRHSTNLNSKHADFEREAMPHIGALYNFALRLTGGSDDAHDLVQETYLKAYRFWDKFESGTNCKAWLFRILKNSYINLYRKEVKEPEKVDFDEIKDFYETIRPDATESNSFDEQVFDALLDDEINAALAALPEEFRTVVILSDLEGFTYEEIAEFAECPIGTVRSRLHRGRKMLQVSLLAYARQKGIRSHENHDDAD